MFSCTFMYWTTIRLRPFFTMSIRLYSALTYTLFFFLTPFTAFSTSCDCREIHIIFHLFIPYLIPLLNITCFLQNDIVFNILLNMNLLYKNQLSLILDSWFYISFFSFSAYHPNQVLLQVYY